QLGAARAGEQIAPAVARMAHADMAEAVEHAFMRDDAVGERELVAGLGEGVWHGVFLCWRVRRSGSTLSREANLLHIRPYTAPQEKLTWTSSCPRSSSFSRTR